MYLRHPTSRSGKVSFSRRMERCTRPSGLNASSAVGVLRCSGVCETVPCWGEVHGHLGHAPQNNSSV